jgi:cell shape-determining protein MreC
MEKSNHQSGVDTLTLQLRESINYELLKRENKALREENVRLRAKLEKVKSSKTFIKILASGV